MTTLNFENAIGQLQCDFLRAPTLELPFSHLKGFASFVQPDSCSENIRLSILAWIPEGKYEYHLVMNGGLAGRMARNPDKACELDPDYVGTIGQGGEFNIEGWKRSNYIFLRIRSTVIVSILSRAQVDSKFY